MLVKVCGITEKTATGLLAEKVDMLGFIFHKPSPRNAGKMPTPQIRSLSRSVETVGVFVDYPVNTLAEICKERGITTVQLHGEESPEYCLLLKEWGFKVIKAFRIADKLTSQELNEKITPYDYFVDLFLFDTQGKNAGGNGIKFNWGILKDYRGMTPYLLSGGIGREDAELINNLDPTLYPGFAGIDLNSKFEISAGEKDVASILEFLECLK